MSIVLSSNLTITEDQDVTADNPVFGYENLVTTSNLSTTSEQTDYPAINLANNNTYLVWKPTDADPIVADQYIRVDVDTNEDVDYIAIAKHNLYTGQIKVSVEVLYTDPDPDPEVWTELIAETLLPNDGPAIFRFDPTALFSVRLRLQPSDTDAGSGEVVPYVGVVYTGKLLVGLRRMYVGVSPLGLARQTKVINNRSESGNFLGRITSGSATVFECDYQNLTPAWYRSYFKPFLLAAEDEPFFLAWRPDTYPNETGFLWLTDNAIPINTRPNGMMGVALKMRGMV